MRTAMKLSLAALAFTAGLTACGDAKATEAAQQDLQRDLQLASASSMSLAGPRVDSALLNSMETKPQQAPEVATTVRRGAGTRAVRSETPTVEAEPDVDVAAVDETTMEVESESIAPVPEPTNEPVAVAPRPAPIVIPASGGGDYGTGGNGGGIFGGGGVVIRGGGVDGDNCELHRNGGRRARGPVYTVPQTVVNVPGVSIGSRSPGRTTARTPDRPRVSSTSVARPVSMRPRGR